VGTYTCGSDVMQGWKSLSDGRTDAAHGEYIGDRKVSHDGASINATRVITAANQRRDEHGATIGPRQSVELLPEPTDDQRYVETENERQRDAVRRFVGKLRHAFQVSIPTETRTNNYKTVIVYLDKYTRTLGALCRTPLNAVYTVYLLSDVI